MFQEFICGINIDDIPESSTMVNLAQWLINEGAINGLSTCNKHSTTESETISQVFRS